MSRLTAKRKPLNKTVGNERWLVSYADFITLLFAFFVVMYSVSHVSESKYKALADTLNATFSSSRLVDAQNPDVSVKEDIAVPEQIADVQTLARELEQQMQGFPVEGNMSIGANENWVELTLNSELLFNTGQAEPGAEARRIFAELAEQLAPYDNEIQVAGHTDNVPINNAQFSSNWALSSARAVAIVNYFAFMGIEPEQMSAVAFGEHRPVADNATEEGRKKNRRVVLRISDQAAPAVKAEPDILFSGSDSESANRVDATNSVVETLASGSGEPGSGGFSPEGSGSDSSSFDTGDTPIKPIRLKGGDLLFTSDPDLPRLREAEPASSEE